MGKRIEALGQAVKLPLLGKSRRLRPGWGLVSQEWKRRGLVHGGDPSIEAQLLRLLPEPTLRKQIFERTVLP